MIWDTSSLSLWWNEWREPATFINSCQNRKGWITYYACPWHRLFTCLARVRSTCAKWNSCIWDHSIFDHLLNSYLWMPTKEKVYEYVRNATHWKKCYVIQGSRKILLTVVARFFIVLMQIVSKFGERWLRNSKRTMCWSLGDFSSVVRKWFT